MPEPKTVRFWLDKGYQFLSLGNCLACGAPIELWESPAHKEIPLDQSTMETHWSSCPRAQAYRQEMNAKEGKLDKYRSAEGIMRWRW